MHKLFSKKKKTNWQGKKNKKITTMNNQNLFYEIKSYLFIYIFCNF